VIIVNGREVKNKVTVQESKTSKQGNNIRHRIKEQRFNLIIIYNPRPLGNERPINPLDCRDDGDGAR
jgi:hypothetical protein